MGEREEVEAQEVVVEEEEDGGEAGEGGHGDIEEVEGGGRQENNNRGNWIGELLYRICCCGCLPNLTRIRSGFQRGSPS